jgi:hypothetical protein
MARAPGYNKTEILQALLDVSKWSLEVYDSIEAGQAFDRDLIVRTTTIINAMQAARMAMLQEYLTTGRAGADLLDDIRLSLGGEDVTTTEEG